MAVNYVKGQILSSNLERDGIDLSISNANVGINTVSPLATLDVNGNVLATNFSAVGNIVANLFFGNSGTIANITFSETYPYSIIATTSNNSLKIAPIDGGFSSLYLPGLDNNANNVSLGNWNGNVTIFAGDGSSNIVPGISWIFDNTGNLTAPGNVLIGNIIIPAVGNISVGNVNINNLAEPVANTDATTKYYVDQAVGNVSADVIGNAIILGTPSSGNLISNAVTLTANTYVTDGIVQINTVLGKLVPPSPSNFPGGQTLTISSLSSYRMANITQTDNTPGANKSVAAGTTVTSVRRAATYATNTISYSRPR
jgi:hypothetical protein